MPKPKTKEFDLTGPGVAPVRIKELDKLAEEYIEARDERLKLTPIEVAAKTKLIGALHEYANKIRLPDGSLEYRYDEVVIMLTPGKETLKVKGISSEEETE
jgi:hypothetical protein